MIKEWFGAFCVGCPIGARTATARGTRGDGRGHNVRSTTEVDAVLALAKSAGATIVQPAGATFWGGYAGFQDPDGHLWEVAWNPQALPPD